MVTAYTRAKALPRLALIGLAVIFFSHALGGCAASNAVLNRAKDKTETRFHVPVVKDASLSGGLWQITGSLASLNTSMEPVQEAPFNLCIPEDSDVYVENALHSGYACGHDGQHSESGTPVARAAEGPNATLTVKGRPPLLSSLAPEVTFKVSREMPSTTVVEFAPQETIAVLRQGQPAWYGLLPGAIIADIVTAPILLVRYVQYVRQQNEEIKRENGSAPGNQ